MIDRDKITGLIGRTDSLIEKMTEPEVAVFLILKAMALALVNIVALMEKLEELKIAELEDLSI